MNFPKKEQKNLELLTKLKEALVWYMKVVPGGILVCFPSYKAMELAYDLWGKKNLLEEKVYFHKRRLFREFPDKNLQHRIMQDYRKEVNEGRGAVLLIVFRANFSEGYNFKD